jgi:hypothetical protein
MDGLAPWAWAIPVWRPESRDSVWLAISKVHGRAPKFAKEEKDQLRDS